MNKKIKVWVMSAMLLCFVAGVITGCQPTVIYDEAAIRAYADAATEITLQGLSEGNLEKYTQYVNAEFKAAVTQKMIDDKKPEMDTKLGAYISQEFVRIAGYGEYILVYYRVTYSKSVKIVRMVFDQDQLVAGQWFEGPW